MRPDFCCALDLRSQIRDLFTKRVAALCQRFVMVELFVAARGQIGIEIFKQRTEPGNGRFLIAFNAFLSHGEIGAETLVPFIDHGIDTLDLCCDFGQPHAGLLRCLRVDGFDLLQGFVEARLERFDVSAPGIDGRLLARPDLGGGLLGLHTQAVHTFCHGIQRLRILRSDVVMGGREFIAQGFCPRAQGCERVHLASVEVAAELVAVVGKGFEASGGGALMRFDLLTECRESRVELGPDGADLALAGAAEFVEPLEAGHQLVELLGCGLPGAADLVGDVPCGIGDHRQVVAQPLHVFERCVAHPGDRVDPFGIVDNQLFEAVGILTDPFGRIAPQIFQVAGLRAQKFACEAQLTVDDRQPLLEPLGFSREQGRSVAETRRFTHRIAQRQQPHPDDKQGGNRPLDNPVDPLLRACTGQHCAMVHPCEISRPASNCQAEHSGNYPVF